MESKIIWVDDLIEKYGTWIRIFAEHGVQIQGVSSAKEALDVVSRRKINAAIVDLEMPDMDGVRLVEELHALDGDLRFVLMSSFHYLDEWKDKVAKLPGSIKFLKLDLPIPPVTLSSFKSNYVESLRMLSEIPKEPEGLEVALMEKSKIAKGPHDQDPFSIRFEDFMSMPLESRLAIQKGAHKLVDSLLDEYFIDKQREWIVVVGPERRVVKSSQRRSRLPTQNYLLKLGATSGYVPFLFTHPLVVEELSDDYGWHDCGGQNYYPTVILDFSPAVSSGIPSTYHFHLDTGSLYSFLSHEEFTKLGIITPPHVYAVAKWGRFRSVFFSEQDVQAILIDGSGSENVVLRCKAVLNWTKFPLARLCTTSRSKLSKYESVGQKYALCERRLGLVGRSFISGNKINLILNGKDCVTKIGKVAS